MGPKKFGPFFYVFYCSDFFYMNKELIKKYDITGPRYTSYPPLPLWELSVNFSNQLEIIDKWFDSINISSQGDGVDLYIHIPFCKSICKYCGCNRVLFEDESLIDRYLNDGILREWSEYIKRGLDKTRISSLHLGGGTPNILSAKQMRFLFEKLSFDSSTYTSIELDPRTCTDQHLEVLNDFKFKKISIGVQDLDQLVQGAIDRKIAFKELSCLVEKIRTIGVDEINFDMIYGLPLQTEMSISKTFQKILLLKPTSVAFFGYAHVPNFSPNQRDLEKFKIISGEEKRNLFEKGKEILLANRYLQLGMDHFVTKESILYEAMQKKKYKLNRNFMGYTITHALTLIGLGASAISSSEKLFMQNEKNIEKYLNEIRACGFSFIKAHLSSELDIMVQKIIKNIMCENGLSIDLFCQLKHFYSLNDLQDFWSCVESDLYSMKKDGLLEFTDKEIIITNTGKMFLRNICMVFDYRLRGNNKKNVQYSKTI